LDILIFTPTIIAGNSFTEINFQKEYGYFNSDTTDYKTAIQMLTRVRNISSNEYHIFISPSIKTNKLYLKSDVENLIKSNEGIINIYNSVNIKFSLFDSEYNENFEIEYKNKDDHYYLYVNEVTFKLQSQYLFKELFINDMKSLGFHIVIVTEFIKDEIKNLIFQNKKEIKELIIEKESQIISNSDNISDKLFNTIKKNNNKSKNERNSIIKFELSKSYSIPIEKIDENFVKIYNDKKLIKIFLI